ncbi:MAG: chemotaxis-specific protein-glutamate methyltransferase CheB [Proteobacteria bacterium]|nr:chemotaxis-specific protein-glutamate methyltransferase CheB [Pseudomonadota bacterium]
MIRVLIVDDSSFMRKSISYLLKTDPLIDVVDTADNGEAAVLKVKEHRPDVVLLDIAMPMMDGLVALTHIMDKCPTPVLILSGVDKRDMTVVLKSLRLGAVDYIQKTKGEVSYDIDIIKDEIINKVHMAAKAHVSRIKYSLPEESYEIREGKKATGKKMVVIGASTGGPNANAIVLSGIHSSIAAGILVVQHMDKNFTPFFAAHLNGECSLNVSLAEDNDIISPGRVFVAPGEVQTGIIEDGIHKRIKLSGKPGKLQSIDYTMESVVKAYGEDVVGVLLTGMGSDGAKGLQAIRKAGGSTIVQDESTCVVFGMPKAAIALGCVDTVAPLQDIAKTIMKVV